SEGATITVYLWGTFRNGTNTDRYAVRTRTEVFLNGVFQNELNDCSFDILPPGNFTAILLGPITFVFGQELTLVNTWVGWGTSAAQCSNPNGNNYDWTCGDYSSSKCSRKFD